MLWRYEFFFLNWRGSLSNFKILFMSLKLRKNNITVNDRLLWRTLTTKIESPWEHHRKERGCPSAQPPCRFHDSKKLLPPKLTLWSCSLKLPQVHCLIEMVRQADCPQAVLCCGKICSYYKNGNVKLFYDFLTLKAAGICYKLWPALTIIVTITPWEWDLEL